MRDWLKRLREEKGLSQSAAARAVGVARFSFIRWENGEPITPRHQEGLVRVLGSEASKYLLEEAAVRLAQAAEPVAPEGAEDAA